MFLFILHLQSNEVLIYFVEAYRKVHNGRISFESWVTTWYSGGSSIKIKTHSRTVDPCFEKNSDLGISFIIMVSW